MNPLSTDAGFDSAFRRLDAAIAVIVLLATPGTAAGLPPCDQSESDSRYLLHLDGTLARAYLQMGEDKMTKRLSDQITAALDYLASVDPTPGADRTTCAKPLACESRNPRVAGDFDSGEIERLNEGHVLVESWVFMGEDEDDDGTPVNVVRFSQLLVPLAASTDGVTGAVPPLFSFERRIPTSTSGSSVRQQLVMDREFTAATFACSGLKRMRARKYDDAYAYLVGALRAVVETTEPERKETLGKIEALIIELAWENWKRAQADDANPSDVRSLGADDLANVFGVAP